MVLTNKKEKQNFLHFIYDNTTVYLERKYQLAQKFIDLCKENPKTWEIKKITPHKYDTCETSGNIGETLQILAG